jgi:microcystin-dependent protein
MEPYIGQIQMFAFDWAPDNWAACNGNLIAIAENQALYALIGITYGGDGITTFALPDLRGRSMLNYGTGPGLSDVVIGESSGNQSVTLLSTNLPAHSHVLSSPQATVRISVSNSANDSNETANGANELGDSGTMPTIYRENPTSADSLGGVSITGTTTIAGNNFPLGIQNPYLGINVCICLYGIFPSRG